MAENEGKYTGPELREKKKEEIKPPTRAADVASGAPASPYS